MNKINQMLKERNIPDLFNGAMDKDSFTKRQYEIRTLLANKMYGVIPPKPDHMTVEVVKEELFAAGKAVKKDLNFICELDGVTFSFPAISVIPISDKKVPAFVNLCFFKDAQNKYTPAEEIIDNGFAIFSVYYKDVTSDDNDFKTGIAKYLVKSRRRANASSKIALWAWAGMRIMDYVETLESIDTENVAVIGHSRLGKTALVTGGFDQRFAYVISNDSGCAGAAIERGKCGETYKVITDVFPFWFCPAFLESVASGDEILFDQHFLTALSVPRTLIIGSAMLDPWADPESEMLGALATNEAYELFGKRGLIHDGEMPKGNAMLDEGDACYYIREGTHYLSRWDWNACCDIIKKKIYKQNKKES